MTRGDIKTEILVRGGWDTTSAWYTEAQINDWINQAQRKCAAFYSWPFCEYMDKSGVFTSGTEENSYPNAGFKTDSIKFLKIGTTIFHKKNFKDYQEWRENYDGATDEVFSDFGRTLYINPNCAGGTIYAFGHLIPSNIADGDENDATNTIFSTAAEDEGNEAIIEEVMSLATKRSKDLNASAAHHLAAKEILAEMVVRIKSEQANYGGKDRKMFSNFNVISGGLQDIWPDPLQW